MPEIWMASGTGRSDFSEKKSRFLGEARPAKSADEARSRIKELREEHPRARHVAWAYVLGGDAALKGMSDDGEPRGTAGRPILDLIAGGRLTDTMVTVVRYFGGVKLGTGGLVSAYGRSASEALARMPRVRLVNWVRLVMDMEYSLHDRVKRLSAEAGGRCIDERFDTAVRIVIDIPEAVVEEFLRDVEDTGCGAVRVEIVGQPTE
ncbi:MAG: YigZ family protein [Spirochaetaceae bacterium]|nr:IMPACT family protein [Spirochaetaceae bacterium]MDT8298345.1 YigZ family protein [Spirochaetaceae bacterium]